MVSMLTFYSDDQSSDLGKVFSFFSGNCLERTKINAKESGDFLRRLLMNKTKLLLKGLSAVCV